MDAEKIGMELSVRLAKVLEHCRNTKSDWNTEFIHLNDIDNETLIRETTILTYTLQRLAIMFFGGKACFRDENTRREIADAFDRHVFALLARAPEFRDLMDGMGERYYDLLEARGQAYFELMRSHDREIRNNDWENLVKELQFGFEQYCRGGGGKDDPLVLGKFSSMIPLGSLAVTGWTIGYVKTVVLLGEHDR